MLDLKTFAQKHIKAHSTSDNSIKMLKLFFDVDKYLNNNKGYDRTQMPQIDFNDFTNMLPQLSQYTKVVSGTTWVGDLFATQNEISIEKVMSKIAKGKTVDPAYIYIVDKNFYILDGHHRHVQTLIQDSIRNVQYIQFTELSIDEMISMFNTPEAVNKDINDNIIEQLLEALNESYGAQGPAAVPGMGATALPTVATDTAGALNPANRGSGDVLSSTKDKKKKLKFDVNKPAFESFKFESMTEVLQLPWNDTHPLWNVLGESYVFEATQPKLTIVYPNGRQTATDAEIKEYLADWSSFEAADNVPKWINVELMFLDNKLKKQAELPKDYKALKSLMEKIDKHSGTVKLFLPKHFDKKWQQPKIEWN